MLINGKPTAKKATTAELIKEVIKLPSSFPDYIAIHPSLTQATSSETEALFEEGHTLSLQKDKAGADNAYERGFASLGNNMEYWHGHYHSQVAEKFNDQGWREEALTHQQEAAKFMVAAGRGSHSEPLFISMAENVIALGRTDITENYQKMLDNALAKQHGPDYNQQEEILARRFLASHAEQQTPPDITSARKHFTVLFELEQGPLTPNAIMVNERGVAFSDDTLLGTSNIQQCTVVTVRDPATKKTALAHVNIQTNPHSLQTEVLDKFPSTAKLDVHLIGSRENAGADTSNSNLTKVMNVLQQHNNVTIKSADIWEANNPTAIVIDPKDGTIRHGVPGVIEEHAVLQRGLMMLGKSPRAGASPLIESSQLIKGKHTAHDVYLDSTTINYSGHILKKTGNEIYQDSMQSDDASCWHAMATMPTIALVEENVRQTQGIVDQITQKAAEQGIVINEKQLYKSQLLQPKHLGPNAEEHNRTIVETYVANIPKRENNRIYNAISSNLAQQNITVNSTKLRDVVSAIPKFPGYENPKNDAIIPLVIEEGLYHKKGVINKFISRIKGEEPSHMSVNETKIRQFTLDDIERKANAFSPVAQTEKPSAPPQKPAEIDFKLDKNIISNLQKGGASRTETVQTPFTAQHVQTVNQQPNLQPKLR